MPAEDADMTATADPGFEADDRARAATERAAPAAA